MTTGPANEIKFFKTLINNGRDYSNKEMYLYAFIPEAFAFPSTIDGRMLMLKYKYRPTTMMFLIDNVYCDKINIIDIKTRHHITWSPYRFLLGSALEEYSRNDCGEIRKGDTTCTV